MFGVDGAREADSSLRNKSGEGIVATQSDDVNQQSKNYSREPGLRLSVIKDVGDSSTSKDGVQQASFSQSSSDKIHRPLSPKGTSKKPVFYSQPGKQNEFGEYIIKEKGVFVIIQNTQHKFKCKDFPKRKPLNYEQDVERFLSIFNLKDNPENVIRGLELTPVCQPQTHRDREKPSDTFEEFMSRLKKYGKKKMPSFVFFVLLSQCFSDGCFLLSTKKGCKYCVNCRNGKHLLSNDCVARNAEEHIIGALQKCKYFKGVPKIFLMQLSHGNRGFRGLENVAEGDTLCADDYIPPISDTLVLHASVKGPKNSSWIGNGTLFLQTFCEVAEDVKEKVKGFYAIQKSLEEICNNRLSYDIAPETIVDGWLVEMFLQTSLKVPSKLLSITPIEAKKMCIKNHQPVFSSSLRQKLSFLKMIESQNPKP